MSARREALNFQLKRIRDFWKQFRKSRRGLLGIAILVGYTVFAFSAPFLTPWDPLRTEFLSGEYSAPLWWSNLPGVQGLSQNTVIVPHPGFTQSSDFQNQNWTADIGPANPYTTVGFNQSSSPLGSAGSEEISYSRPAGSPLASPSGVVVVTVRKTFNWPYNGPPNRFVGNVQLFLRDMRGINYTALTVFIGKGALDLPIRNQSLTNVNINQNFNAISDSHDPIVRKLFGSIVIDPAGVIFFESGQFSYGFKITIPDLNPSIGVNFKLYFNNLNLSMLGTSWGILGTDQYGRDIFTQLAWGARVSLLVGIVASLLGIVVGLAVGLLAGYLGKLMDEVLMRVTDLVLVLPGLPLLIVLAATLGPSIWNIILVLGLLGWAGFARVVRSQVLSLRERPFIEASKAAGSGTAHIIGRHILPNVLGLTYVSLALAVPTAIVSEAALAFLGLRDPSVVSWGGMLNDVQTYNGITQWWWVLPPGISIALLSLSFILLGYALDETLNPKLRMRR